MKSIFDLKTKTTELTGANQGLINYRYTEIPATRNVSGDNFPKGEFTFRWTYGDNKYWIPNKSYIKVEYNLQSNVDGRRLEGSEQLALNMNAASCLFSSAYFKISDQTVSAITQNLAQVDALKMRMTKSGDWMNKMGSALNHSQSGFEEREQQLHSVGGNSQLESYLDIDAMLGAAGGNNNGNDFFTNTLQATAQFRIQINRDSGVGTLIVSDSVNAANLGTFDLREQVSIGDVFEWDLLKHGAPGLGIDAATNKITPVRGVVTQVTNLVVTFIAKERAKLQTVFVVGDYDSGQVLINAGDHTNLNIHFYRGSIFNQLYSLRDQVSQLLWTPPLSIFDVKHAIPCAGSKQELSLTPFDNIVYQRNIIQSVARARVPETDYLFEIYDVKLYLLTCESNQLQKNFEFMIDFNEVQCQTQRIQSSNGQSQFEVIGSCNGISIALQDGQAGSSSLYPLTQFTVRSHLELTLTTYYIRYENQVPQPDFDGVCDYFTAENTFKDLYLRTKLYDGSYYLSSPESYGEYLTRGLYIYHPFPKTASSRNTRVYVQTGFDLTRADNANNNIIPSVATNLLLFQHYKKVVLCKVVNGRIVNVLPIDS